MSKPWWWVNLQPEAIWFSTMLLNEFPGMVVTSAWRSPAENKRVKGVKNSGHMKGWCVDFVSTPRIMQKAAARARKLGAYHVLVHDSGSGLHLHCDWRP